MAHRDFETGKAASGALAQASAPFELQALPRRSAAPGSPPPAYRSIYPRLDRAEIEADPASRVSDDGSTVASSAAGDSGMFTASGSCLDMTACLAIAPDAVDAARVRELVFEDPEIVRFMKNPSNTCFDCARRVQVVLNYNGIRNACRGAYIWNGISDEIPETHFAILVRIRGETWVVDPTAAQFSDCAPMLEPHDRWIGNIRAASSGKAIVYRDFSSLRAANVEINSLFRGSPLDFEGQVLNAPRWYAKITENPERFRKLKNLQRSRENLALRKGLKREIRRDFRKSTEMLAAPIGNRLFPPDYCERRRGASRRSNSAEPGKRR